MYKSEAESRLINLITVLAKYISLLRRKYNNKRINIESAYFL